MVEGHKACSLSLHNLRPPPLTPDIPLSILLSDSRSFSLHLIDQVPHPLKGRVVLEFHTSSGGHYEVKEITANCHISGSHSGVVAESCSGKALCVVGLIQVCAA
jgi:hypothetical protein